MVRLDLTSFLAAVSFFACAAGYIYNYLSFKEFCHVLLMAEGVLFLAGALSATNNKSHSKEEFEDNKAKSLTRFNQTRYVVGLIFFFIGSFVNNLK